MRTNTMACLMIASCFLVSVAYSQVRINEVGYAGVDFNGAGRWVELHNTGEAAVDVSAYWLCNFPDYSQVGSLTLLAGSTTIAPGDYLVVAFEALGTNDGEVGLYQTNAFGSADAMTDYLQYGAAGHQRESVAVEAGLWQASAVVAPAPSGQALGFVGLGRAAADNWASRPATPGRGNGTDPSTAPRASVDRFSADTGTLFVRDATNGLPAADQPVDFDRAPFLTRGFGPDGQVVAYYNFDVQATAPAPIYVLFREGEDAPVDGQLNIVDVVPGDDGYNDFWRVVRVTVPSGYVANTITSLEALQAAGFDTETTPLLVNCPVVPEGSTAALRLFQENSHTLVQGWYRDQVVHYFEFAEASLTVTTADGVPVSPIYVAFNLNPGQDGGGPPSGFMTEAGSAQTHNVVATVPGDATYSPLWVVNVYDNAAFDAVRDLATAEAAPLLAPGAALVNCPIVSATSLTAVERQPDEVPSGVRLHGNYPNPFNPSTTIPYEIDRGGHVTLSLYDLLGKKVIDLVDEEQQPGVYRATWDGRNDRGRGVATGVYLYRLTLNGEQSRASVMTLLK